MKSILAYLCCAVGCLVALSTTVLTWLGFPSYVGEPIVFVITVVVTQAGSMLSGMAFIGSMYFGNWRRALFRFQAGVVVSLAVSGLLLPAVYFILLETRFSFWGALWRVLAGSFPFSALPLIPLVLLMVIWRRADRIEFPACAKCGYDLTGNASGTCPECGTPTTPRG